MKKSIDTQFDFGENWLQFSEHALTKEKVVQAKNDFKRLTRGIRLNDVSFLDIGFGQGLSLLIARLSGSRVLGCEINSKCIASLNETLKFFPTISKKEVPVVLGSILDKRVLVKLRKKSVVGYDVVHSWGVLHHTGDMRQAIENISSLVKENGYLILAIYNKHWSSPTWEFIKKLHSESPNFVKKMLLYALYPIILLAKVTALRRNPFKKGRGMDFYYDVVDWVGGYPYEYASIDEVRSFVTSLGFKSIRVIPARTPTGCNEYIFKHSKGS
ncbi:MAG: class I SAM-dependent methyltransferase [Patescibacteria group bacterium]